jgi:hypothetical protein
MRPLVLALSLTFAGLAMGCSCAASHPIHPDRDGGEVPATDTGTAALDAWVDPGGEGDTGVGPPGDSGPPELADGSMYDLDSGTVVVPELCPDSAMIPTGCLVALNEGTHALCNQLDDDCDGNVDEGCGCTPGAVQPCFRGPPGRRGIGACADGTQQCTGGEFGTWGTCTGGIAPTGETCDGLDNDCNGCTDEIEGCIPTGTCPGPGDPRVPDAQPFVDYGLHGGDFFSGSATAWRWTVTGGPCDTILPRPSFTLTNTTMENAVFHPTLSGDYTVTMDVTQADGSHFLCTWIVHVLAPGLRIEMCYPEASTEDLDLFLSRPGFSGNWYVDMVDAFGPAPSSCGWHDCEATIRGTMRSGTPYSRASWGYADSPISACSGSPQGAQWRAIGHCANPRLDIDNNLSEGIGVPENINVDDPHDGDQFRVMVQNFTGTIARPVVNVYCDGRRVATYGVAPDDVPSFAGTSGYSGIGAMWRVADVLTHVDASGATTCDVTAVHPPGTTSGYDVTYDMARF